MSLITGSTYNTTPEAPTRVACFIGTITKHSLGHQVMDSLTQGSRATALRPGEPRAQTRPVTVTAGYLAHSTIPPGFGQMLMSQVAELDYNDYNPLQWK